VNCECDVGVGGCFDAGRGTRQKRGAKSGENKKRSESEARNTKALVNKEKEAGKVTEKQRFGKHDGCSLNTTEDLR
jgi:hypothetical protein